MASSNLCKTIKVPNRSDPKKKSSLQIQIPINHKKKKKKTLKYIKLSALSTIASVRL